MIARSRRAERTNGSPPVRIDFPDFRTCPDIVECPLYRLMREHIRLARADHFAPETEATVDRADMGRLKQNTIRITMHDTLDGAVRIVADWIRVFHIW